MKEEKFMREIKLPHIQDFYEWCEENEIPEDIMYKIAGWLASEIYEPNLTTHPPMQTKKVRVSNGHFN